MIDSMDHGFNELNHLLNGLMTAIEPAGQRKVLRAIGKEVRRAQMQRIAAQKNPDGSAYKPRQKKWKKRKHLSATKFLYPAHGSGAPRVVFMKSWQYLGRHKLAGFDIESGSQRTFLRHRIIKFLPVLPAEQNKNAGKFYKPSIKQRAMFKKIRGPRFLKSVLDAEKLNIGFFRTTAAIAESHQYGQDKHPVRELLGWTKEERETLLDMVLKHIEES